MLDFSILSDDQLIELIQNALAEAMKRGQATVDAAREVMLSEKEKAEIKAAATARAQKKVAETEAERIAREAEEKVIQQAEAKRRQEATQKTESSWAKKKALAEKVAAVWDGAIPDDLKVSVWNGSDKRVYVDAGRKRTIVRVVYYIQGNDKKAPGTIEFATFSGSLPYEKSSGQPAELAKAELKEALKEIATKWESLTLDVNAALQYEG